MRRIIAGILFAVFLLTLGGCSSEQTPPKNPIVDACKQTAQQHIDNGDFKSAIQVLEEGFAVTKDPTIQSLLEQVNAMLSTQATDVTCTTAILTPTEKTNPTAATESTITTTPSKESNELNIYTYVGTWAEDGIGWENGGLILDIAITVETIDLEFVQTQSAPACRIATAFQPVAISNIAGNKLFTSFLDDWGNKGKITLEFSNDKILCTISDVEFTGSDYADWGLQDGQYTLVKNNNAHDSMQAPSDGSNT